jgi:hypothetical protein
VEKQAEGTSGMQGLPRWYQIMRAGQPSPKGKIELRHAVPASAETIGSADDTGRLHPVEQIRCRDGRASRTR